MGEKKNSEREAQTEKEKKNSKIDAQTEKKKKGEKTVSKRPNWEMGG